jgi:hypothetical protein
MHSLVFHLDCILEADDPAGSLTSLVSSPQPRKSTVLHWRWASLTLGLAVWSQCYPSFPSQFSGLVSRTFHNFFSQVSSTFPILIVMRLLLLIPPRK